MKQLISILACALTLGFFSAPTLALEAEGTIDEIRVCSLNHVGWRNLVYVKLSTGDWFWILGNERDSDGDDNMSFSIINTAYAARYKVKVKASWISGAAPFSDTRCGISGAPGFWHLNGDYIALKEYSE